MTDNAAIVREALNFTPDVVANKPTRKDLAYRALDALVAERDEAIEKHRLLLYDFGAYQVEAKAKQE